MERGPNFSISFQFHDGTIDSQTLVIDTAGKMYFNSTMVRLIANNAIQNAFTIELFQFHDGTIDRSFTTITLVSVVTFQFHDGTIDSQF